MLNNQEVNDLNTDSIKHDEKNVGKISGTIGIIACPMLEDELIYDIVTDTDEKKIYVVDTGHQGSFVNKLEFNNIDYCMVDEYSFDSGIDDIDKSNFNLVIYMNQLGLHAEPKNLRSTIEHQVAIHKHLFDAMMVFYGMCGNFGWDISKVSEERSAPPVITIRDENGKICDDCIGVAVGGTDNYFRLNKAYCGVLYLTPATATNWNDFMSVSDMSKGLDPTDHSMMRMLFEICGYKYALRLDTGLGDRENYEKCAQEICREMNLELIDPEGSWTTLEPIKRAYAEAKDALKLSKVQA